MKRRQRQRVDDSFALEPLIREMYALGISLSEIALLFKRCIPNAYDAWSAGAIAVFITRFGGAKAFPSRPRKRDVFAAVLKRHTELVTLQHDAGVAGRDDAPGAPLRAVLAEFLREQEILAFIRGVMCATECLALPSGALHRSKVAHADPVLPWRDYCTHVAQRNRPPARSWKELYRVLTESYVAQWRKNIMPIPDDAMLNALLQSVDVLGVSVRASNVLCARNIRFLGDLVQRTEAEMLQMRLFGLKSLMEVQEALARIGLSLGTTLPHNIRRVLEDAKVGRDAGSRRASAV